MKKGVYVMVGIMSSIIASGLGGITSYATSRISYSWAYETTATFNSAEAQAIGYWYNYRADLWSFIKYQNGAPVANAYIESFTEPGVYYYVDDGGRMLVNGIYEGYVYGEDGKRGIATDAKYFTYNADLAARVGHWKKDGIYELYSFIRNSTGDKICEAWVESQTEPGVYYFLQVNGALLTSKNSVDGRTPDGYVVDEKGRWYSPDQFKGGV